VVRKPYGGDNNLFNDKNFNVATFKHPEHNGGPNAAADALKDSSNLKHKILREFEQYAQEKIDMGAMDNRGSSSAGTSRNSSQRSDGTQEVYKTTCFKQLVSQTWSTLEQIYDRQMEQTVDHTVKPLHSPFKTVLEGYEYMGIVTAKHVLTRRSIELDANGSAWSPFIKRIYAITLFGRHFGEVYTPSGCSRTTICKPWTSVPRGQQYLVAPVLLLKDIRQNSVEEGEVGDCSHELAKDVFWFPSKDAFKKCGPICRHIIHGRVQNLSRKYEGPVKETCPHDGAVIFGENSILDMHKIQ
jgi:hypothetical protein